MRGAEAKEASAIWTGEGRAPWLVKLARSDEAAVTLHAHLNQIARHRNRLANGACRHARCHLGEEWRLVLGLVTAEKSADVLVADRTEAGVRDVARDRGRHARVQPAQTLSLIDVDKHTAKAELRAGEVSLALELQAGLGDVDRESRTLRRHRRRAG